MKTLLIFFTLALTSCGQQTDQNSSLNLSSIVNGTQVDPTKTETRYIVNIYRGCAGSIIAPQWILTAAHCYFTGMSISGGSVDLNADNRIPLEFTKVYVHPRYKTTNGFLSYDYALIKLQYPIELEKKNLTIINIADSEFENAGGLNVGTKVTAFGWGYTKVDGSLLRMLRQVELEVMNFNEANGVNSHNGKLDESMLVAGTPDGSKDACQGDSGGPLTAIHPKTGKLVLAGIISWGYKCAQKGYPGVYSKVSLVHDWIMQTIKK